LNLQLPMQRPIVKEQITQHDRCELFYLLDSFQRLLVPQFLPFSQILT
jgi:hypothetical protein